MQLLLMCAPKQHAAAHVARDEPVHVNYCYQYIAQQDALS